MKLDERVDDYFEEHASTRGLKAHYKGKENTIGIYYKYYMYKNLRLFKRI